MSKSLLFTLVVLLLSGCDNYCKADPNTKRLLHHLIDKYNQLERPVRFHNETLIVSIQFKLHRIAYVDWPSQQIGVNGLLHLEWMDINLVWNASEFGDVDKVGITPTRIWTPDIAMFREVDGLLNPCSEPLVVVHSNGNVIYDTPGKFQAICDVSVMDFPFDEQSCDLEFGSWTLGPKEVLLTVPGGMGGPGGTDEGDTSDFSESHNFRLTGFPVTQTEEPFSRVTFTLKLVRKGEALMTFCVILTALASTLLILSSFSPPSLLNHKLILNISGMLVCLYGMQNVGSAACTAIQDGSFIRMYKFYIDFLILTGVLLISNCSTIYIYSLKGRRMPLKVIEMMKRVKSTWPFEGLDEQQSGNKSPEIHDENMEMVTQLEDSKTHRQNALSFRSCKSNKNCQNDGDWPLMALMLDRIFWVFWTIAILAYSFFGFPQYSIS